LSLEHQLKGVRAALSSPRTPKQLKTGLRKREKELSKKIKKNKKGKKNRSFWDFSL
jgi:hypothetical protein